MVVLFFIRTVLGKPRTALTFKSDVEVEGPGILRCENEAHGMRWVA